MYLFSYRLWNNTLAEDYPKVDSVNIVANGKIVLPPNVSIQQNNETDDKIDVSLFFSFSFRELASIKQ